jgi:N-acetylglucosaminyldiphosphoundecaprenol N-acetyl-beta-D-mannosaminyltransferase
LLEQHLAIDSSVYKNLSSQAGTQKKAEIRAMTNKTLIPTKQVLSSPVTALRFDEQMFLILKWARARQSKMVCLANVHMLMEAYWHEEFASVLKSADVVSTDGMPLVWMLRQMGMRGQDRVAGMDVYLRLCQLAASIGVSVYFVGSQAETLAQMQQKLSQDFPNLKIAGMEPLPFRPLTPDEDAALIQKINDSGAGLVMVCLGCPKQEYWMFHHLNKINAVMIGVGAVFSLYAGQQKRAPQFVRNSGLEWFYRLIQEPKRLWHRYSQTIPPFILLASKQLAAKVNPKASKKQDNPFSLVDSDRPLTNADLDAIAAELESIADDLDDVAADLEKITTDSGPAKIGEILVKQNIVSEADLSTALEEQRATQKKVGEILTEKGYISQAELNYYVKNQGIKLGELLIENLVISRSRLNRLLDRQQLSRKKLGEVLVEEKVLSTPELQQLLIEQYCRRHGMWLGNDSNNLADSASKSFASKRESFPLGS